MSEIVPITDAEQLMLQLFGMFGNDTAAVVIAKDFIGSSTLNFQLLQMSISDAMTTATEQRIEGAGVDWVVVANRAVQLAKEKLTAFN